MTIKIVEDGPDIVLTASEADRLHREWQKCNQYTVNSSTFEEYVRRRLKQDDKILEL